VLEAVMITVARFDSDHGSKLPESLNLFIQFLLMAADVPIRERFEGEARQSAALTLVASKRRLACSKRRTAKWFCTSARTFQVLNVTKWRSFKFRSLGWPSLQSKTSEPPECIESRKYAIIDCLHLERHHVPFYHSFEILWIPGVL